MVAVVGIGTYGVVVTNTVNTGCHHRPGSSGRVVDTGSGVVMVVGGGGGGVEIPTRSLPFFWYLLIVSLLVRRASLCKHGLFSSV